jgi:micrococcal nuclease
MYDFKYEYKNVSVIRVLDGDTIECNIEICPKEKREQMIRFARLNCPEKIGPTKEDGLAAKAFTTSWLKDQIIRLGVYKEDDFGRWISEVFVGDTNLNDVLLESGHAVPYKK